MNELCGGKWHYAGKYPTLSVSYINFNFQKHYSLHFFLNCLDVVFEMPDHRNICTIVIKYTEYNKSLLLSEHFIS